VLVHHGKIMTARGLGRRPAGYLRDVGILDGKGPGPGSLLTLLYVLPRVPTVPRHAEQSAVDMLGPRSCGRGFERADRPRPA